MGFTLQLCIRHAHESGRLCLILENTDSRFRGNNVEKKSLNDRSCLAWWHRIAAHAAGGKGCKAEGDKQKFFHLAVPFRIFSQRLAARATFAGAVAPKLVRDLTEASTDKTLNTDASILA